MKAFLFYLIIPFGIYFLLTLPHWLYVAIDFGIVYSGWLIMSCAIVTLILSEWIRQKFYYKF